MSVHLWWQAITFGPVCIKTSGGRLTKRLFIVRLRVLYSKCEIANVKADSSCEPPKYSRTKSAPQDSQLHHDGRSEICLHNTSATMQKKIFSNHSSAATPPGVGHGPTLFFTCKLCSDQSQAVTKTDLTYSSRSEAGRFFCCFPSFAFLAKR